MKPTLSLERFNAVIEDRNFTKARQMYREMFNDLTTAQDALAVTLARRKESKPLEVEVSESEFPTYAVTSGGRLWKNAQPIHRRGKTYANACGWQEFDKHGKLIGSPIGHLAFRKKPLGKKSDEWVRLSRPEGTWRRYIDCILNHEFYGNGKVLVTDGHHALFEYHTSDGQRRTVEVIFANLREIAVRTIRKTKESGKGITKPKEAKVSALVADLLDLL